MTAICFEIPCINTDAGVHEENEMEYRNRLMKAVAHALGRYMAERFMGRDAEVQLRRYKRLGKDLEEYDNKQ